MAYGTPGALVLASGSKLSLPLRPSGGGWDWGNRVLLWQRSAAAWLGCFARCVEFRFLARFFGLLRALQVALNTKAA